MHTSHRATSENDRQPPGIESFAEGDIIFNAGDPAHRFHILLGGSVALSKHNEPPIHITGRHAFGVEGIISTAGVYPCTALALEPCRVATYQADVIDDILQNSPRTIQLIMEGLSHVLEASWTRFGKNNPANMQTQFVGRIQTKGPGQWVMKDGEMSTEIYRIISTDKGLEVVKNDNQLAVIKEPGEIFGEMAFLLNEGRTAGIRSLGNSVLEVYSPEQLTSMLSDYPDFSLRVITTLAQRLAKTSRELAETKNRMEKSM
ncbi:cyclic nucleotide-binding domain-containing protein [Desulfoplanes sp. PS50]|jgi:CRP-like cAMP-binding protein